METKEQLFKVIVEANKITSLAAAFNLQDKEFRIFLKDKGTNPPIIEVVAITAGNTQATTVPVAVGTWSDVYFKELPATCIDLTKYDVYYGMGRHTDYSVAFDSAGGTAVVGQKVNYKSLATEPTDPTKDDAVFAGWFNGEAVSEFDFDNTSITDDITLTAHWNELFDVTFDSNGGTAVEAQEIASGSTVTEPTDPTKANLHFDEWQLDGSEFNFATPITGDTELAAQWYGTVTFNSDGGSAVTAQNVTEGETATEPTAPTKEGFTFVEWQLSEVVFDFDTPITADITLTAIWVEE